MGRKSEYLIFKDHKIPAFPCEMLFLIDSRYTHIMHIVVNLFVLYNFIIYHVIILDYLP